VDDVVEGTIATDSVVLLLFLRVDFVVVGKVSSGNDITIFVYSDDDDDVVAPSLQYDYYPFMTCSSLRSYRVRFWFLQY
jgi:hypothetical protein